MTLSEQYETYMQKLQAEEALLRSQRDAQLRNAYEKVYYTDSLSTTLADEFARASSQYQKPKLITGADVQRMLDKDETSKTVYALTLEELRATWLAAFGRRWVTEDELETAATVLRLVFKRLYDTNQLETLGPPLLAARKTHRLPE